jgi:hypothetical protein
MPKTEDKNLIMIPDLIQRSHESVWILGNFIQRSEPGLYVVLDKILDVFPYEFVDFDLVFWVGL